MTVLLGLIPAFLVGLLPTHLSLNSHPFVMTVLLGLIPAFLVGLLPTHLLWHLVTLLDRLLPAFLGRLFPALCLWDIDANFMGDGDAALLGHLLTHLVTGALLEWNMFAHFLSLETLLVVDSLMCLLDVNRSLFLKLLQSNLLGSKTNGKVHTKSKFLPNVPTNQCTKTSTS